MQGAFSEHDYGQAGSDASSPQQVSGSEYPPRPESQARASGERYQPDPSPVGLWSFLYATVGDDDKTRRLGYLIKQAGLATSTILLALGAATYIAMYKAPLGAKIGVGVGSFLLITVGSTVVRLRKHAKPGDRVRGSPRAWRTAKPPKATSPNQDGDNGIRNANGAKRQHTSHEDPENDLGETTRP